MPGHHPTTIFHPGLEEGLQLSRKRLRRDPRGMRSEGSEINGHDPGSDWLEVPTIEFLGLFLRPKFQGRYTHKIWPEKWYVYVPRCIGSWDIHRRMIFPTSIAGWRLSPTPKNDGDRQWGWDDIPIMKWKIPKSCLKPPDRYWEFSSWWHRLETSTGLSFVTQSQGFGTHLPMFWRWKAKP
jgi:hypothetical protein